MSHKLITMLGKVKQQNQNDYRKACYCFSETENVTSSYFGLSLAEKIQPDEIIVLGTKGSMWDNLFLQLAERFNVSSCFEELDTLRSDAQENAVKQNLLDKLSKIVSKASGTQYKCQLISYAQTEEEQVDFIEQITNLVENEDKVTLDITHGLRHLPLLVQQVAALLPILKNVKIDGIYYGALDLTKNEQTPVMRLDGILVINEWQKVFAQYDKTQDISVFCPVLEQSNVDNQLINHLQRASFYEQTHRPQKAQYEVQTFLHLLNKRQLPPVFKFFQPALEERLNWISKNTIWERRYKLSRIALENKDFFRASLYGFEAFVDRILHKENNENKDLSFEDRKKIVDKYVRDNDKKTQKYYHKLRIIRNIFAHGEENSSNYKRVQSIISSGEKLDKELDKILTFIYNDFSE